MKILMVFSFDGKDKGETNKFSFRADKNISLKKQ